MPENKPWWKSKTLYFNLLSIAVIVLQTSIDQNFIPMQYQAAIILVGNVVLRLITTQGVSLHGTPKADVIPDPLNADKKP